ncbi:MAG: hypothetical protein RMI94_07435 [Bryobacterales bacterium]|nr:hypothetical protein [Bryobacteraceae bacterium]MDW8130366.1 hypothetical protein [Bryobacterales bacterium]
MSFTREEWLRLENFCRTHPAYRELLLYLLEHPEQEHTPKSASEGAGRPVSFYDLKALYIYKLLGAVDRTGAPVRVAWDLDENSRFRLIREKEPLIRAVLERREPAWDENERAIL